MTEELRALSVAEVVDTLRRAIEGSLGQVWVKGEIGELKVNQSGHWFFTLRDADCSIRCAMWATYARRARVVPPPGTEVYMLARPDFWAERGELRMTAVTVLPTAGVGDAQLELQRVREALAADGLFDPSRKRALPRFPRRVAIVTSLDGAALHDMVTVARRRWPARIVVVRSVVQGEAAERALVHALTMVNRLKADVCVVGRGGGSKDDLSAFNLEKVCRAIAAVKVPVVTAVGHQTDFTLADMVADARAATPSAAMELVLPDRNEVLRLLGSIGSHLGKALGRRTRLVRERLYRTEDRLSRAITDALYERRRALDHATAKLDALSPLRVLARGYAVARGDDGRVLRRTADFETGKRFNLRVSDGDVPAKAE
ncbi:MAG TPA: exodeoxyribonuclease VII large subunit [Gemmatimonadales bacterium]|nr:exodeoxyribonuclease VII large subunit [Gemmatimonadales bacterium]